jgi:uncharacterized membrane protein HdeD (DUF308 family)
MAMMMGIVLIVLGVLMLSAPVVAGMASVMMIGSIMIIAGIVEIVKGVRIASGMSKAFWMLVGVLTILCGAIVCAHPIFGLGFLTLLLAIYFFVDGIVKVGAAFKYSVRKAWFVTSGILSFILAFLIWSNWPLSGGWVVGVLVGVNFISTGILTLMAGEF